jgi:hypothetical protein
MLGVSGSDPTKLKKKYPTQNRKEAAMMTRFGQHFFKKMDN